jgi:glucosamine--fructose-6-phosphate aminotransferase (isomerizing)
MCSIIGMISKNTVAPALVESLKRMEYRGYDSVGVATLSTNKIYVKKGIGKVGQVNNSLNLAAMEGFVGIGHTRWATHGGVTDYNAHPHPCCTNEIALVHNGIIENYLPLKEELVKAGHRFRSETDTEVIVHLLEEYYKIDRDIKHAMIETVKRLEGSFAFVAMFANGTLAGARLDEPLVIGISDKTYYASSDVLGFLQYTDQAIFLDNRDIAIIGEAGLNIFNFNGDPVTRDITKVAWELADANKGEFAHYTLKEIFEQRTSVETATYQEDHKVKAFCDAITSANNILVTGSGSSYHTSLIFSMLGTRFLKKHFEPVMASEFKYNMDSIDKDTVIIAISQSGETADVLSATKLASAAGAKILSIVNVQTSSLARIADVSLSIKAGPEIGVAATKSFTGQVSLCYAILDKISQGKVGFDRKTVSDKISKMLAGSSSIEKLVNMTMPTVNDIYILGRSIHFPIALEGALKMKELAYVHAEGIAAGELKHGPLALMDKNAVVFVLNPDDKTYMDTLSSAYEVKARGAKIIGISNVPNKVYDEMIEIPKMESEFLYPLVEIIPLQLFSYYLALQHNADPDFPRNLAKSVTVR